VSLLFDAALLLGVLIVPAQANAATFACSAATGTPITIGTAVTTANLMLNVSTPASSTMSSASL
jgi:hypothetical protein